MQKIIPIKKFEAAAITGGLTQTSKMPCKSYSLPTEACATGYRMAQVPGTVCHACYADKGNYFRFQNSIKPQQFARLDALTGEYWVQGMAALIGRDEFFRWHDSGDLQGLWHLEKIAQVCELTPSTRHWLPTREFSIVKQFIAKHGRIPDNLVIRLSAMHPDKPVKIPASLRGVPGVTASNVHTVAPLGRECIAPAQGGECRECRACWGGDVISYAMH